MAVITASHPITTSSNAVGHLLRRADTREMRVLVDRLRGVGLDQFVKLPQIVVAGDALSGKSSLLSALSGVPFPSSDQLSTTRCATQLVLRRGVAFRGNARLVRFQRQPSTVSSTTSPTTPSASEADSITTAAAAPTAREELRSVSDVPAAIVKLTRQLAAEGQSISDDRIVVELHGPELPDLTLTDLPGLVSSREDRCAFERVRALVDRYMAPAHTIIVAVVAATADVHPLKVLQAAQLADPTGERTVAVVTKLDLVAAGAEQQVLDLVLNKRTHVALGCYVVRCICSHQADLNTHASASVDAIAERAFFRRHASWRCLSRRRCGVERLSAQLAAALQRSIRRSLPRVMQEVDARIDAAWRELRAIGDALETPEARRRQFSEWVNAFARCMDAAIHGDPEPSLLPPGESDDERTTETLWAALRCQTLAFQRAVDATNATKWECDTGGVIDDVYVGAGVEICTDAAADSWAETTVTAVRGMLIRCDARATEWLSGWRLSQREVLKRLIRKFRGDELAVFPSHRVFCALVRRRVDAWEAPAAALLRGVRVELAAASERAIESLAAPNHVEQLFRGAASAVLRRLAQDAAQQLAYLLRTERRPYTQDTRLLQGVERRRVEQLEVMLLKAAGSSSTVSVPNALKCVAQFVAASEDREVQEMDIALQAYADVASRRFVDAAVMQLHGALLADFVRDVERELMEATDETLVRLMQDSDAKCAVHEQLAAELQCLKTTKAEIERLGG